MRLSRSVYEALPYVYMLIGVGAFAASFKWRTEGWSDLVAGFGLIVLGAAGWLYYRRQAAVAVAQARLRPAKRR